MFRNIPRGLSWPPKSRVRKFDFINGHLQRLKMYPTGGTNIQGYLTESNDYKTESKLMIQEDKDDGVVEMMVAAESQIDDGEGWVGVNAERDEVEIEGEDDRKNLSKETLRDDLDDFEIDGVIEEDGTLFELDELLELERDGIEIEMQEDPTIVEAIVLPLNLKESKDEDSDDDWESDSGSEGSNDLVRYTNRQEPIMINGVEVVLTEAGVPYVELELYDNCRLGRHRCHYPSPLRMCWAPVEV